jgi:hypothetical protein
VLGADRIDAQYFRPLFSEVKARLLATGRAVELGSILTTNARDGSHFMMTAVCLLSTPSTCAPTG